MKMVSIKPNVGRGAGFLYCTLTNRGSWRREWPFFPRGFGALPLHKRSASRAVSRRRDVRGAGVLPAVPPARSCRGALPAVGCDGSVPRQRRRLPASRRAPGRGCIRPGVLPAAVRVGQTGVYGGGRAPMRGGGLLPVPAGLCPPWWSAYRGARQAALGRWRAGTSVCA